MPNRKKEAQARLMYVWDRDKKDWTPYETYSNLDAWIPIFHKTVVISTGVVYSQPINVEWLRGYFSIYWQAVSAAGGVDLLFQYQVTYNVHETWVIPDGAVDIVTNMTTEVARAISVQPIPTNWLRLMVTGNAGNSADTLLNMWFYGK